MGALDADYIIELRKIAGMPSPDLTTYYNLAGPDKKKAVGRLNGEDKFVVPMEEDEYRSLEKEYTPEGCYRILYGLYCEEE